MMVREAFPEMPIHLSVQANAVNWATVKFWAANGVERVIVSRELSLEEIEEIREHCPETELEVFVHGALCMAYSGRCLLLVTSTNVTLTKVHVLTHVVGSTKLKKAKKTTLAIS